MFILYLSNSENFLKFCGNNSQILYVADKTLLSCKFGKHRNKNTQEEHKHGKKKMNYRVDILKFYISYTFLYYIVIGDLLAFLIFLYYNKFSVIITVLYVMHVILSAIKLIFIVFEVYIMDIYCNIMTFYLIIILFIILFIIIVFRYYYKHVLYYGVSCIMRLKNNNSAVIGEGE